MTSRCLIAAMWALPALCLAAPKDRVQLDETVISGNQELPKVLYILPWRDPDGLPELGLEAELVETEVFRRLYPPAYRRELRYLDTLEGAVQGASDEAAGGQ